MSKALKTVTQALGKHGLLLLTDAKLPSLVSLIAGAPVKGTWWSHPLGNVMYNTANALEDEKGVLTLKLVSGKITYVDPAVVPEVLAAVSRGAPWQLQGFTAAAKALLAMVERAGELRMEKMTAPAKELEVRLLVQTTSVHTESGAHAKVLRSWSSLSARLGGSEAWDGEEAEARLAARLTALNDVHGGAGTLPWTAKPKARPKTATRARKTKRS